MSRHDSQRIVTLLPSATEIVCELGLRHRLVGVTHECDYPDGIDQLPHVTSSSIDHHAPSGEIDAAVRAHLGDNSALYTLNEALLRELKPDLIITQALCDVCAVSEDEVQAVLAKLPGSPELINLEPMTLGQVFDTIELVGQATDWTSETTDYLTTLRHRVNRIKRLTAQIPNDERPTVGFLEWIDPPFNAGHWTPEIIELAGGIDLFGNKHQPSETISLERLFEADPDVLIMALCGFSRERALEDVELLKSYEQFHQLTCVRSQRLHVLNGNDYFSRPGPRLVDSLEILCELLHPGICAD